MCIGYAYVRACAGGTTEPTSSSAWNRAHPLFVRGWVRHSLSRVTTHRVVGPHAQRLSERPPAGARTRVGSPEALGDLVAHRVLVPRLQHVGNSRRVHNRRVLGCWSGHNTADG